MEGPKNLKPGKRSITDVTDSTGDCLPYASDHRIVSPLKKLIGTQGPDSSVSLGYGSVESGTTKSSVSPDSDAYPPSSKKLFKMPQVDVTDASPMSQDNVMSSSGTCAAVMPVEKYAQEYNMNHKRRGKAVIFNHEEFQHLCPRHGSAVDVRFLTETYGALGFEVIIHENLEYVDICNAITELAKEDHSDADCLLVTVLTHGKTSSLLAAYDCHYDVVKLWSPFAADKCLSLAGKPKIFIIGADRGSRMDPGVTLKQGIKRWTETDSIREGWGPEVILKQGKVRRMETDSVQAAYNIPTEADFLIAYSTKEGYVSWRHSKHGTWFIQSLCKELQEHGFSKHFVDILTRTSRRVAIDYESQNEDPSIHQYKQVPSFNSMLIRDLYFRPKI